MIIFIASVFALLSGISVLLVGQGLLGISLGVRVVAEGFPDAVTGVVMSCYFGGVHCRFICVPTVGAHCRSHPCVCGVRGDRFGGGVYPHAAGAPVRLVSAARRDWGVPAGNLPGG